MNKTIGSLLIALLVAACSPAAEPEATSTTTAETTTSTAAPTTTTTVTTTTEPTTSTEPETTTTAGATALDDLEPFFTAVAELDADIGEAAEIYNAGFDPDAGTVSQESIDLVTALTVQPLVSLIPAGMDPELETAILAVYTDLESRIAALDGGVRYLDPTERRPEQVEYALDCLQNGSESNTRFGDDVDTAKTLAATLPPLIPAAPESVEAGMLALKIELIGSFNYGCDSCGGAVWDGSLPIDWERRTLADGVGFEATFNGTEWEILIYAC